MIDATKYYFSPSAMTVTPNMVTGGFTRSETIEVSVVAGAAIKVANKLVTQANRELNLGYNAQLGYRQFTFLGYNTVLGHPNNQYIGVPVCVYIRLDASNNGSTGELVFLPYEVDYDGRLLLAEGSSPVIYDSIPIETHTDQQGNTYYTLANTNENSDSGLYYYYIHIATLSAPVNGQRAWTQNLQIGQLETSKGNDEKEDPVLEKMFRLVNNVINVLLPFDKLSFSKSAPAFVERILTTTSETIDDFATWAQDHALATTASIASYVSARLKILDDRFFRKDQPDTDPHLATFGNLHIASGLDKGDGTTSEGNLQVDGSASSDNFQEGLVGGSGWSIWKDANGVSTAEFDKLNVRMKAVFAELEVKKYTYSGGNVIYSDAGNKLLLVLPMDASGNVTTIENAVAYRCCWLANDGEFDVKNDWAVGDQARCQTNNFTEGTHQHAANRYYWRKVLNIGEKWEYPSESGIFYNYIDLAANVSGTYMDTAFTKGCQTGVENDIPAFGDSIVQMGHQGDNAERQNLIILVVNGDDAPAIKKYQEVNDYSLSGKMVQGDFYDPTSHTFKTITYGDMYVGDKAGNSGSVLDPWNENADPNSFMRYTAAKNGNPATLDISARVNIQPNSKIDPSVVQVGATNLLLNTGFRGQHQSRNLNASTETSEELELWSPSLEGWNAVNAEAIEDADSASGKACVINNGTLSQNLVKPMLANADYFLTFKGKGESVTIQIGEQQETIVLTNTYSIHHIALRTHTNISELSLTGAATICELFLEKGTVYSTTWSPSPYDADEALDKFNSIKYLTDAIQNASTTVLGGLILSNLIELGNYVNGEMQEVTAGVSGVYNNDNDIAFWGGGTLEKAIKAVAMFRKDPTYQPTPEEWASVANTVITHGGRAILNDAIFRGSVYAENGKFHGRIEAEEGYLKNMSLTGYLNIDTTYGYKMQSCEGENLSALNYTIDIGGDEHRVLEYGLMQYSSETHTYTPFLMLGDPDDVATNNAYISMTNKGVVLVEGGGFVNISSNGLQMTRTLQGSTAFIELFFEEEKDPNTQEVIKIVPHMDVIGTDESTPRRIF